MLLHGTCFRSVFVRLLLMNIDDIMYQSSKHVVDTCVFSSPFRVLRVDVSNLLSDYDIAVDVVVAAAFIFFFFFFCLSVRFLDSIRDTFERIKSNKNKQTSWVCRRLFVMFPIELNSMSKKKHTNQGFCVTCFIFSTIDRCQHRGWWIAILYCILACPIVMCP
jgi:hypothetical protein